MTRQRHNFLISKLMLVDLPASIWGGMSIELKAAELFISADLVQICWSLNQQICTDFIASQTSIFYIIVQL